MSKELDVQAKIRKSVKADGGYCHKLTNRFTIGIPDLLVGLWPFVPCLLEVKDLGVVVDKFNLKIDVTSKQQHELRTMSAVYEDAQHIYTPSRMASGVLVALVHKGKHRLVALPTDMRGPSDYSYRLDHTYEASTESYVERGTGGYYAIKPLLGFMGICQIAPMP